MIRQEDHQGRDPTKTYFAVDMRHQSRQEQGMAAFKLMMKEHLDAETSFWPLKGSLNKYWVVIDKVIQRDNLLQLLTDSNKFHTGDKNGPLDTFMCMHMQGTTTTIIKPIGRPSEVHKDKTFTSLGVATVIISGWPCTVTDRQLGDFLEKWGIVLDFSTDEAVWFFGVEMEGMVVRIRTRDFLKAQALMLLRTKKDFDLEVGEMTNANQKLLRVLATTRGEGVAL